MRLTAANGDVSSFQVYCQSVYNAGRSDAINFLSKRDARRENPQNNYGSGVRSLYTRSKASDSQCAKRPKKESDQRNRASVPLQAR